MTAERRFADLSNAGRCETELRDGSGRCLNNGKTEVRGRWVCGIHARGARRSDDQGPVNPTLVTAADYETDVRPHIAALEAEVERLTEQLAGAVAENEKLRLQVAALENDGMELAARLGEAEEQIARLAVEGGQ